MKENVLFVVETTYRGVGSGYLKTCSVECRNASKDYRGNQSKAKRVRNNRKKRLKKELIIPTKPKRKGIESKL